MKRYLSSYPELVKEWHPTKNGDLTPKDVTHEVVRKYGGFVLKVIAIIQLSQIEQVKMLQVVQNVQETKLERIINYWHYFLRLQKNGIQLRMVI